MRHLDLFSGIGGFALAASWVWGEEHEVVSFVEIDPFCQKVLRKHWPGVPIHGDIKAFRWNECEQLNSRLPTAETSESHLRDTIDDELGRSVNGVPKSSPYPQAMPSEETDSADGNVGRRPCEAPAERMPEGDNGCEGAKTQTGKMVTGTSEVRENKRPKSRNGEEGSLREITTLVGCADFDRRNTTNSMPTTSDRGPSIQSSGLTSPTVKQFAAHATKSFTRGEKLDLLTAGVPCQPASVAGKRTGTEDDRWLWDETLRIVAEAQPRWVLFENPTGLLSLQGGVPFENVLSRLEGEGYEVFPPLVLPACAVGAPHRRDRVWIVGQLAQYTGIASKNAQSKRLNRRSPLPVGEPNSNAPDTESKGLERRDRERTGSTRGWITEHALGNRRNYKNEPWGKNWYEVATRFCGVDARIPNRVDRLKGLGNAIVPQCAAVILRAIKDCDENH